MAAIPLIQPMAANTNEIRPVMEWMLLKWFFRVGYKMTVPMIANEEPTTCMIQWIVRFVFGA